MHTISAYTHHTKYIPTIPPYKIHKHIWRTYSLLVKVLGLERTYIPYIIHVYQFMPGCRIRSRIYRLVRFRDLYGVFVDTLGFTS